MIEPMAPVREALTHLAGGRIAEVDISIDLPEQRVEITARRDPIVVQPLQENQP